MNISATIYAQQLANALMPECKHQEMALEYAWSLLEQATKQSKAQLLTHEQIAVSDAQRMWLEDAVDRIVEQHEPLAYILKSVPFLDLIIEVEPPVLIPRPETEEWVSKIIEHLLTAQRRATLLPQPGRFNRLLTWLQPRKPFTILDLCTGSGCIALAFAKAFPKSTVFATDISAQALILAQRNAKRNNISNVVWLNSDLFKNVPPSLRNSVDLIVANPPYISEDAFETLDLSVKNWEDPQALVAPDNGYALIERIIAESSQWLKSGARKAGSPPQLCIEIDASQGKRALRQCESRFAQCNIMQDFAQRDRVLVAW